MKIDDNIRSKRGVVASLKDEGEQVRLVFDDVKSSRKENPKNWKTSVLYTWKDYEEKDILNMNLTDQQYKEIGEILVLRLVALYELEKKKDL